MSFIGIVTNPKNEAYMKEMLKYNVKEENLQFITDKNIGNMRNVQFETLMIDKMIKDTNKLKKIIANAKYVFLNSDLELIFGILEDLDLTIITYGFNNKATISISSIEENSIWICLQRTIKTLQGKQIEPQEFEVVRPENMEINSFLGTIGICLLYEKSVFEKRKLPKIYKI